MSINNFNIHNHNICNSSLDYGQSTDQFPRHTANEFPQDLANVSRSLKEKYGGFQSTNSRSSLDDFNYQTDQWNKTTSEFPAESSNVNDQSNGSSAFPDIVVYISNNPKEQFTILKRAFAESSYGDLVHVKEQSGNMITLSLVCTGHLLAKGSAKKLKDATAIAACSLIEKLQDTNYTIVQDDDYFTNSRVPHCVRNVDPSLKHIYRVVFLENKSLSQFPHCVTGAVDFVQTEDELWQYVEDHCKTNHKVDLFILNIEKSHRRKVNELCKTYEMNYKPLNGCSDRGAAAMAKVDLSSLFHELKECGGKNLKYRLIPPRNSVNESDLITVKTEDGGNVGSNAPNNPGGSTNKQDVFDDGKEVVISNWIADNLIIMDVFNHNSVKETAREILFLSVRESSAFNEFIIEKSKDKFTGKITASALIDRKLVGGATGYVERTVKMLAAENALNNLKNYCYYIEGKLSYFGINGSKPNFLFSNYPRQSSSIYRIVDPQEVSSEEDLNHVIRQFKSSNFEDLFLLEDIPVHIRDLACSIGTKQYLEVRQFGFQCVCIYKKQRPRQLIKILLSLHARENEKYRLRDRGKRAVGFAGESNKSCTDEGTTANISNLFDFKVEHSQGPVYYNRSGNEEPGNRDDEYEQKYQGFKRDHREYQEDSNPSSNKRQPSNRYDEYDQGFKRRDHSEFQGDSNPSVNKRQPNNRYDEYDQWFKRRDHSEFQGDSNPSVNKRQPSNRYDEYDQGFKRRDHSEFQGDSNPSVNKRQPSNRYDEYEQQCQGFKRGHSEYQGDRNPSAQFWDNRKDRDRFKKVRPHFSC